MRDAIPKAMYTLIKYIAFIDTDNRKGCFVSMPENQNQVLNMHASLWKDESVCICGCVCMMQKVIEAENSSGRNCSMISSHNRYVVSSSTVSNLFSFPSLRIHCENF